MKNFCQLPARHHFKTLQIAGGLTALCLFAVSPSCKQKTDYSVEISRLDSAASELVSAEKTFLSLDTNSLRSAYDSTLGKLRMISAEISGDTVNKETAIFLSDAYEQTGNISTVLNNKKYFGRALQDGQQRISDLKHDLQEDLIEKNKSAAYVVNEMNASQKISEAVNNAIVKAKISSAKLDSMKTQILFLSDSLNLRNTK